MKKIKVYLRDNEIRITSVANDCTLSQLYDVIKTYTKSFNEKTYLLKYEDDEKEWVSFSSDIEWEEAKKLDLQLYKIKISKKKNVLKRKFQVKKRK